LRDGASRGKPRRATSKIQFGWRNLQGFGTVKFLLVSPEYLEGLDFSATFGEAEKSKVVGTKLKRAFPEQVVNSNY